MGKMTDETWTEYETLDDDEKVAIGPLRAHIAALTDERDRLEQERDEALALVTENAALRERVKALEAEYDRETRRANTWRERAETAESRLAAIRQRAEDWPTIAPRARRAAGVPYSSFVFSWQNMEESARQQWRQVAGCLARYILGDDTPAPVSEPLHCCGTTTTMHKANCPTVATLAPLGMAPPSETDGMQGEMAWHPCGNCEGVQPESCATHAPTTAEAFAVIHNWMGVYANSGLRVDGVLPAISLLERRMGVLVRAVSDAPHGEMCRSGLSALLKSCDCWKSRALTDAPPVFTLEEVREALGRGSTVNEVVAILTALRGTP